MFFNRPPGKHGEQQIQAIYMQKLTLLGCASPSFNGPAFVKAVLIMV